MAKKSRSDGENRDEGGKKDPYRTHRRFEKKIDGSGKRKASGNIPLPLLA